MARVAIYGGAFNPPHLAHVFTAAALLSRSDVDEVWLMPTYGHVFGKKMAAFTDRVEMLRLALAGFGKAPLRICEFEGERQGTSRTYETLQALEQAHPEHDFIWVMGADNLTESHRWYRFDDLVARWPLIVFGRPGHEAALERFAVEPWCEPGPVMPDISSTRLREALAQGGPEATLRWIPPHVRPMAHRIYGPLVSKPAVGPVLVLGAGRAGMALATALEAGGVEVTGVWNRSPRQGARFIGGLGAPGTLAGKTAPPELSAAMSSSPVWLVCVSDGAIGQVAEQLAWWLAGQREVYGDSAPSPVVLHCAGLFGAEVLSPIGDLGLATGSVHPVQTLQGVVGAREALRGARCAVEGAPDAISAGRALVEAWEGHVVELPVGGKPVWHAAAVFAGNGIGALMGGGTALLTSLGLDERSARKVLTPLQRGTVEAVAGASVAETLTGPVARGDVETVRAHVKAISEHCPEWLPLYRALVEGMVRAMDSADAESFDGARRAQTS